MRFMNKNPMQSIDFYIRTFEELENKYPYEIHAGPVIWALNNIDDMEVAQEFFELLKKYYQAGFERIIDHKPSGILAKKIKELGRPVGQYAELRAYDDLNYFIGHDAAEHEKIWEEALPLLFQGSGPNLAMFNPVTQLLDPGYSR